LNGITVIADGGSVISGSTNPGITISVTPGTLVENTAISFVKATSDVSNPILNNSSEIPGLIPSEDLYGIPTSYTTNTDINTNAKVVTSDGILKNANLVSIPTSLEAQIAVSTTSSSSSSGSTTSSSSSSGSSSGILVSSSSTSGGIVTSTIPVFNPSNNSQVQQLETAVTKNPKVITGAGAAPLLIILAGANVSQDLLSKLSMTINAASPTFPPLDPSKVVTITTDPESVIKSIQDALGGIGNSSTSGGVTSSSGGTTTSTSSGSTSTSGGSTTNNSSADSSVGNFINNLGTVDIIQEAALNNTPVTPTLVKGDFAETPFCRLIPQ